MRQPSVADALAAAQREEVARRTHERRRQSQRRPSKFCPTTARSTRSLGAPAGEARSKHTP
jgi:hypothetical protein